jgi:hypothetical protein
VTAYDIAQYQGSSCIGQTAVGQEADRLRSSPAFPDSGTDLDVEAEILFDGSPDRPAGDEASEQSIRLPIFREEAPELIEEYVKAFEKVG